MKVNIRERVCYVSAFVFAACYVPGQLSCRRLRVKVAAPSEFEAPTVHPRRISQKTRINQIRARNASHQKSETGFRILVKNRVESRIYFPEKVSLKISVDFDRDRFSVTYLFSRDGMRIFEFPGIDYPRKTYPVIDLRELIFFESENFIKIKDKKRN